MNRLTYNVGTLVKQFHKFNKTCIFGCASINNFLPSCRYWSAMLVSSTSTASSKTKTLAMLNRNSAHSYHPQHEMHVRIRKAYIDLPLCKAFSTKNHIPTLDPNRQSRRNKLMLLTYVSGLIGFCLLSAIGAREYKRLKNRAIGIEEIKLREYGRKPVMCRYRGYVLPNMIGDYKSMHSFEIREDDIWIVSFPKSGTTWVQEIVYLIVSDLDFEKAKKTNLDDRSFFFEFPIPGFKTLAKKPSPRIMKSHLPFSLLPNQMKEKTPKTIYIVRNPKDTVVSFYNFSVKFLGYRNFTGNFDDYCRLFVSGTIDYGPFWKHVKEAWDKKEEENVLFLFYEDLQKDLKGSIHRIASFLGKDLRDKDVEVIAHHCSYEQMKHNKAVNYSWLVEHAKAKGEENFLRKGKVGDWKNHLSQELVEEIDNMVATKLQPHGIVFCDTLAPEYSDDN